MKKKSNDKVRFNEAILNGGVAMLNRDYVYDMYGNKGVINKIDPESKEWTFLIRFKDMTLKWMPYKWIRFEKGAKAA